MPTRLCCCSVNPNAVYVVVGNKIDLDRRREITMDEVKQRLADVRFSKDASAGDCKSVDGDKLGPLFFEASAKSGIGVKEAFEAAAREACVRLLADPVPSPSPHQQAQPSNGQAPSSPAGCQC